MPGGDAHTEPAAAARAAVFELARSREALSALFEEEETLLTMADVEARLHLERRAVLAIVRRGGLPMFKLGGQWVISRKAYRRAMERNFKAPSKLR